MRILITGNMGYVGPEVVRALRQAWPDAELIGFDMGFFSDRITRPRATPEAFLDRQVMGDTRYFPEDLLRGTDVVVHLAAISNDPMGNQFEDITRAVNQDASIDIASKAANCGVGSFVFASSCSVYGIADGPARKEDDPLNPVTAYAKSKIATEAGLARLDTDMAVTCLRFATACGMSDRLRLDLVLNDFVACALTSGRIAVLSDGTPWRPLIDTQDMARAIVWAADRDPQNGGRVLTVNTGSDRANYQVAALAQAVAGSVAGTKVEINTAAPADSRSYKVDFSLFEKLAPHHQPQISLQTSIDELVVGLRTLGFGDADFRNSSMMRLKVIEELIDRGRVDRNLRWLEDAVQ